MLPQSSETIHRKVDALREVYRCGGGASVARHLASRLAWRALYPIRHAAWRCQLWYRRDHWWLGKIVELRGNRYRTGDLEFSLDNPRITTRAKSRFFRSDYEEYERLMLGKYLDPSLPTVEVGACIGVVSCLTNRCLEDPGRHVVIEANPYLIPTLEANRDRNGCGFSVLNRALAYGGPSLAFSIHELFVGGSVQRPTSEQVEVRTTGLRQVLDDRGFDIVNLVFDAEGAEVDLVEHEAEVLGARVARLLIEFHGRIVGQPAVRRVIERLEAMGLVLEEQSAEDPSDATCVFINRSLAAAGAGAPSKQASGVDRAPRIGDARAT